MTGLRASVTVCAVTFLLGLFFLRLQYTLLLTTPVLNRRTMCIMDGRRYNIVAISAYK